MKPDGPMLGPLRDGATAVVVGGGPGGTAAAIAIRQGMRAAGREARVVLVEAKRFADGGHYNQCMGVLSPPIARLLCDELGVPFPQHLSRGPIAGYVLHAGGRRLLLTGDAEPSVAMRRIHFDTYMLDTARQRGVEVLPARLTGAERHPDGVVVFTDSTSLKADVVVGAFGLDAGTAAVFSQAVGYRPPPALRAILTKYHPGDEAMTAFGPYIHAFLPGLPGIEFGAVTPKGNHLTISIAGARADARHMDAFLRLPALRQVLVDFDKAGHFDSGDLRYFRGHFPCGLARNIAGDRFVIVGDAAGLVRAFKGKGMTSAIQTGLRAAQVIVHRGIAAEAFREYHHANRDIVNDLPFGQAMRHLAIIGTRLNLVGPVLRAAEAAPSLRQALFDAVSAHRAYREVVRQAATPAAILALVRALLLPVTTP